MKTILVLSSHPDFAEAIRASLNPEQYRVVHRHTVEEGEPLLVHGLISACVLDADFTGVECVWIIERLRRRDARTPIIAYTGLQQADWEEEAFLRGVTHVLTKPVRSRLFNSILERLWSQPVVPPSPLPVPAGNTNIFSRTINDPGAAARFANASQTLSLLRDFSSIMTHSLDAEAMLKQFLQFLREILSVNRAAIFLNRPSSPLTEVMSPDETRRLRAAAAIGLSSGLLQHFELSLDSGIGAQINKLGRILRRESDEARADGEADQPDRLRRQPEDEQRVEAVHLVTARFKVRRAEALADRGCGGTEARGQRQHNHRNRNEFRRARLPREQKRNRNHPRQCGNPPGAIELNHPLQPNHR